MGNKSSFQQGMILAFSAYLLWGFLPIYWKQIDTIEAGTILAHRIIWSCVFMILLVMVSGKWRAFVHTIKHMKQDRKKIISITLASIVITLNWFLFIFAVNGGHVLQASLGYYINPILSILLGLIILKEPSTKAQIFSFILAGAAVIYLTLGYGIFPWISIFLAASFAIYGFIKKTLDLSAMFGLTLETLVMTPFALLYIWLAPQAQGFSLNPILTVENLFLIGGGIVTAIPLLLFAAGARRIPLASVGFLQYVAPTVMFFLGVFLYKESFTTHHMITFLFIWLALAIYMYSLYKQLPRKRGKKH
ncbi:EamA family transporter RarD [Oceanobacillus kimchii]|uniref:Transporter n=1 Tax=Oceanobacillus kimchii TaxID=746691 RepID=A0ABQ5TLN5_9BACI|nr:MULTISPECIES: EamA family transporter RarD [Oceanobacillus]MBT2599511.1 EamA family transporter RarD [Oceanobacillus sp. ISL-74]MCT1576697.1 EamA family transporter RarD [Oceanobacillus kimchii]MCT2134767.1 EamA family transporter RarD [Oceanobacillus kimchii]GLO67733.1 transporter [Oceanobacillus kimchii]